MKKGIMIRIYPNKDQKVYLSKLFGCNRVVYNICLDKKESAYKNDKVSLGLSGLSKYFHGEMLQDSGLTYLQEHNTKILKQSIIDLMTAYSRFFKHESGYPNFKTKYDEQSVRIPFEAIPKKNEFKNHKINIATKLKNITFACSKEYNDYLIKHQKSIKSMTVSMDKSDHYFVSVLVDGDLYLKENSRHKSIPTNEIVGLDFGIKTLIETSEEGVSYENKKVFTKNVKKIKRCQKNLSRKKKGSNNFKKNKKKLAKLYYRMNNQREAYIHEITNDIIDKNQVIVIEDLNVKGMMKNHNLAKSIREASLGRLKVILLYKAKWYGREVIEVGRFFASSKICSECGYKNKDLKLSDREWVCPKCGVIHDRDKNAGKTLKKEGVRIILSRVT